MRFILTNVCSQVIVSTRGNIMNKTIIIIVSDNKVNSNTIGV